MKDLYKRLSYEWGSCARKEESRQRKTRLRKLDKDEIQDRDWPVLEPGKEQA